MICDDCKKNPATRVYRETHQNKTIELHLCDDCAEKRGIVIKKDLSPAELLKNMLRSDLVEDATLVCPNCLLSFAEFKRLGRFGCAQCAQAFRARLGPIVSKIHGARQHIGKVPRKEKRGVVGEIFRLRAALKEALEKEEYEKAAEIRDNLKKYGEPVDDPS
jgi:protein arginine kinase activator